MGNALMERSFDQYKYVKILSKGEQRINGKKYYVENDLYDVLPSDFSKKDYKLVVEDGKVHADYPREFINKDYGPPTVEVHQPIIQKANTVAKKYVGRTSIIHYHWWCMPSRWISTNCSYDNQSFI